MTKRTPQIEDAILDGFADGHSLRDMCRAHGISRSTFHGWKNADPDFAHRYEDAQAAHADSLVDDCMAIVDDPGDRGDPDRFRRARMRMDGRLRMARVYHKRYDATVAARRAREEEEAEQRAQEAGADAKADERRAPSRSDKTPPAFPDRDHHVGPHPMASAPRSIAPTPASRPAFTGP